MRNKCQEVPTLLWFHANGRNMFGPTMLHVVGQQCYVRLHGPLTSHNVVHPTMLGAVGTYCVVRANERNNCKHRWRFSKEMMHSGTPILVNLNCTDNYCACADVFTRPTLLSSYKHGRNIVCAMLRRSQNNINVWTCQKFDWFQTMRNKCQHCCGFMQTDATCSAQQCCVLLLPCAWAMEFPIVGKDGGFDSVTDMWKLGTNI